MKTIIWHNPRCSKSRQTLQLLQEHGIEPEVRLYLQDPPSRAELDRVLKALDREPRELMRINEPPYKELGLGEVTSRAKLIEAMVEHPALIERPVVIRGDRAALGRPPEAVLTIL